MRDRHIYRAYYCLKWFSLSAWKWLFCSEKGISGIQGVKETWNLKLIAVDYHIFGHIE